VQYLPGPDHRATSPSFLWPRRVLSMMERLMPNLTVVGLAKNL
jgi:hypothetical protein